MIRRKGSGQFDTEYSVTPVKTPTAPTKEQEAEADKVDLLNATKGKWLEQYDKDRILPDPVSNEPDVDTESPEPDQVHEVDDDEEIKLNDIPF